VPVGSTGNASVGAGGTVARPFPVPPPEGGFEWPGAWAEFPGALTEFPALVELAFRWPGAVLEWLLLLELELEWPGAEPECPGLVEVVEEWPGAAPECPGAEPEWPGAAPEWPGAAPEWPGAAPEWPGAEPEWPGAVPECPGLVEVVEEWPGAAPACPGLLEPGLEELVVWVEPGRLGVKPRAVVAELRARPRAAPGLVLRAVADDPVPGRVETAARRTARAAGEIASAGARPGAFTGRVAGVP